MSSQIKIMGSSGGFFSHPLQTLRNSMQEVKFYNRNVIVDLHCEVDRV